MNIYKITDADINPPKVMYSLLFPTPEARILDTLAANADKKLSLDDIVFQADLQKATTKKALEKLKIFNFIEETGGKYSLKKNEMMDEYLNAARIFYEENENNIFEKE
ncbi:MAG: hypothetical protein JSW73_01520 [Candidatus Woesearchaeota archaeon]|nr:MAG: hypothetical protein JSW73_01520 [Candidatus Woesearchaeota archaeon]